MRDEIAAIDREVLDALNRRLGLVRRISEHKASTGAPAIDAKREAELLTELAQANGVRCPKTVSGRPSPRSST